MHGRGGDEQMIQCIRRLAVILNTLEKPPTSYSHLHVVHSRIQSQCSTNSFKRSRDLNGSLRTGEYGRRFLRPFWTPLQDCNKGGRKTVLGYMNVKIFSFLGREVDFCPHIVECISLSRRRKTWMTSWRTKCRNRDPLRVVIHSNKMITMMR